MKLIILVFAFLFLAKAEAQKDFRIQAKALGGYAHSSFSVTSDSRANFGGSRAGGEAGFSFHSGRYGMGGFAGYRAGSSENSANNTDTQEKMTAKTIYGGGRAYAADAHVSLGLVFQEAAINLKNGATTTQATYTGFGLHIGLGIDIYLGQSFFVSPGAYYERTDLSQKDASVGSRRLEEGGLVIGIGFAY